MTKPEVDIVIVGAGPVGMICAYLAELCELRAVVLDKSATPLQVGRADALNARTLQLLEIVDLFKELYPLGKRCNTSSVWANGQFVSRQSTWWEELEGCFHKHFLMLGQAFIEQLLDEKLCQANAPVRRHAPVIDVRVTEQGCLTTLACGEMIASRFVIGADGSRSLVREIFNVPFEVTRPQITWAVLDGVIETDFPKVPEIIVFQAETSDVAWIPREGNLDRFYVRMDTKDFTFEEALGKIKRAIQPHSLNFKELVWYSQFSVKESVADQFVIQDRVFLAGDACHIHSVNGGQGLNTGLADAFNLIWKIHMVLKFGAPTKLLLTYEEERKPVALSVVDTSGQLVRSTKYAKERSHAEDYVKIVERRAGNITGMGIRYGTEGLKGSRLFDFMVHNGREEQRIYSLLDYARFTLLIFSDDKIELNLPPFARAISIGTSEKNHDFLAAICPYKNQIILVRPDGYIAQALPVEELGMIDWEA